MSVSNEVFSELLNRSGSICELCGSTETLVGYEIEPRGGNADEAVCVCSICGEKIATISADDKEHWGCINGAMWSEVTAVQVLSWRILDALKSEAWALELLEMLYLDEDALVWAESAPLKMISSSDVHKDCFGNVLTAGDSVTLVKDLPVKGAGFTAKRGTTVRNISLVYDNSEHIEGRVEGQQIVILTKFVKKV